VQLKIYVEWDGQATKVHITERTQKCKVIYPNQKITFSVNELSNVSFC